MYPDETEELFSVVQGITLGNNQETLGVKKYPDETQEHLEVCEGTKNERRGIHDMSTSLSRMSTKTTRTSRSTT